MRTFLFLWIIQSTDAILFKSTPSYVSEWKPMTANSSTSRVTLHHGLQEDPAFVKVEAQTESGFIFSAFGSAQQDDDASAIYGGVVFVYNSTHIDIFVSHWRNNRITRRYWAAVYTGNQQKWVGPQNISRLYSTIKVQAKAWKSHDLPPVTWMSQAMNVSRNGCLNESVEHSLNRYPDLIVVQARTSKGIFQGQGLSSLGFTNKPYLHFGGVLYGTNESHVQLWSACNVNGTLKSYGLLCVGDGWGDQRLILCTPDGSVRVSAWTFHKNGSELRETMGNIDAGDHLIFVADNLTSYNFVNVQIHVLEGANEGFRFDGIGSVMNEAPPYGGLVYGYNDSMVAIWLPYNYSHTRADSHVFLVGKSWGWGFKAQETNNVDIIINVMDILMPVCLLEVNTSTTSIVTSFRYDRINDSILKFAVGDEIIMHCNYGYKALHQNLTMVCKDENNGSWSHDPLECAIECPYPEVHNTSVITMDNTPGGVVSVVCIDRHRHIRGDLERTCNMNGTWTGTPPVCKECKCPCSAIGSTPIKSNETEKLEQRIKELRSVLTVQKNMTAKARRRKVCASDPRPSAKGVGVVLGVGVLVVIISCIVVLDLSSLISFIKSLKASL